MTESVKIDSLLAPLYAFEIPYIQQVQDIFKDQADFLVQVSRIGDPSKAFYLYFPIIFGLHRLSGIKFLGTVILCEWLNQILKWMSHGHRPYWWAKQNLKSSSLIQTEVSCETGLGNPSGHVMINLVIGLAFVTLIRDHLVQHWEDSNPLKIVTNRLLKNVFYVWTGVVVASRIFISAHFPHQCFLAIGFGYLCFNLGFRNGKSSWTNWRSHVLILVSLSFLLSALGVYLNLEQVFGFDPDWSIELARKFCKKKEWIYIDTTPLYAMVRYSGTAIGLAFSVMILNRKEYSSWIAKLASISISISLGLASNHINKYLISRENMTEFYTMEYFLNASVIFVTVLLTNKL